MDHNPIQKLFEIGQSIWFDNLSREMILSGQLQKLIGEGMRGITSNPTIFQKAISGSAAYDGSIRRLWDQGVRTEKELFLKLALEDISRAADLLWPVYQSSRGEDGFVSVEVSPDLAGSTEGTIREARQIFTALNRKNILIKVPATPAGVPAIEELIGEGVNVNVTLLFAVERYVEVAESYLRGLERRVKAGQNIGEIASVASFFVSRVDTLVDQLLEARRNATPGEEGDGGRKLLGRAAVINARLAYWKYREIFSSPRFLALEARGAKRQRVLWASTGTKNPKYSDVKYVDELIAPQTVNTVPEATLKAFQDHGRVEITIGKDQGEGEKFFQELQTLGIDMAAVTERLEKEGVQLFADSYFALLEDLARKKEELLGPPSRLPS